MRTNVLEYFENGGAKRFRERVAIEDGERRYTFAEIECYAKRCAALLVQRCGTLNRPIAVYLPKCAGTIFADLGIVYSGNAYCNLGVKSPAQRIRAIVEHIEPAFMVTSRALLAQAAALGLAEEKILAIEDAYDGVAVDDAALAERRAQVIDTDPLCIINTSGSTGIPKSVALTHRGTLDFMDWCFERFPFPDGQRIGSLSPFFFDIYTLELNLSLAQGATMVLIPDEAAIFPASLVQFLASRKVSFIFWVPTVMVAIANQDLLDKFDLSALRCVFFAGEVFPTRQLNRWRRALPGARFVNLYGPIEITVDCTFFEVDREFADDELLPIGLPCRNSDILILTGDNRPAEPGEHGELCVRGTSLALGYWNDPARTAQAFVQNPLQSKYPELIYRTGDIAFRNPRGEIMLVGRRDFQIKHLGYRIELGEIEHRALAVPGIAHACVLYNKSKKEITLFYEASSAGCTPAAIRKSLGETLPKYMLPTAFHALAELPRNPNGKVDRHLLSLRLEGAE